MKRFSNTALIAGAAIMLASCGGSDSNETRERQMEEAAARHGIDADVTLDSSGETEKIVINAGGGQVGQGLDLPADFPSDVNLPSDWNIIAAAAPLPNAHSIQALSDKSTEDVVEDIRSSLSAEGWTETASDSPTPQMARINFEKEDRMANFNIIANGETRAVQVVTMPKP